MTIITEPMIAIGRLRRGLPVSSASGATDSKPVKVRTENTMPRKIALKFGADPGFNGAAEKPPGPGWTMPESPRAQKIAISKRPVMTISRPEILMPLHEEEADQRDPDDREAHHGGPQPNCCCIAAWVTPPP